MFMRNKYVTGVLMEISASLFHFEWYVDQKGYEPVSAQDLPPGTPSPVLLPPPKHGWYLRRKGGPLRAYRPLEDYRGLFRRFAYLPEEPQAILEFANEFGILGVGRSGLPDDESWVEEHVLWWYDHIRGVRYIVEGIDGGKASSMASIFNRYVEPRMTVRIVAARPQRASLHVVPTTLLAAIWLQVAGELTEGTSYKKCRHCPNWFPVGPGTGHKRTKMFCSTRCRVAWNRRKGKETSK